MPSESTNKRIAKNTLLLYVRILLTMVIGLYTSRVVLAELGISDYGLYSVVGGIVTMFTFINGSLNAGTQRFLTFELGRGDIVQLKKLFSTAIVIYTFLAMIILFLAEMRQFGYINFPSLPAWSASFKCRLWQHWWHMKNSICMLI